MIRLSRLLSIRNFEVAGFMTGYADYKLLTSKFKRDYQEDKYGRGLFKKSLGNEINHRGGHKMSASLFIFARRNLFKRVYYG